MAEQYYVFILTDHSHAVLYTGLTSDLKRRVLEHRTGTGGEFTRRYKVGQLVYFEVVLDYVAAIEREKQLRDTPRPKKIEIIELANPDWKDLYGEL